MSKIKILPNDVIQKIAAGEVVESPASVLKELMENAIDAGANAVKVVLANGGLDQIQVVDDGVGLSSDDLPLVFERHSTSKIAEADDLLQIHTLGFRGEALYSVSAVASVLIETREKDSETGFSFTVKGGEKGEVKVIGAPIGTMVTVTDLFFNVPARKKFLKSSATEFKHCREVFTAQALSHPELRFELVHNMKTVLQVSEGDFLNRIVALCELSSEDLIPVFYEHQYLKIAGFVGKPGIARSRKTLQQLIVNHRAVENKLVYSAVKQAFGMYLPQGSYPVFFLDLELRPDLVDVNIHPRKEEVKFAVNDLIFNGVREAVGKALQKDDLTPRAGGNLIRNYELGMMNQKEKDDVSSYSHGQKYNLQGQSFGREQVTLRESKQALDFNQEMMKSEESIVDRQPLAGGIDLQKLPWEEVEQPKVLSVYQLDLVYLVEVREREIVIYDQHAVHERVQFERFIKNYLNKQEKGESQTLLFPEEISCTIEEIKILNEQKITLEKIGFELTIFPKKVAIFALPVNLKTDQIVSRFRDFLDGLISREELTMDGKWSIDRQTLRMLTFLSCKTAIKAGDKLTNSEIDGLLSQFKATKERYTCPHGRPVVVKLGRKELDRMFMRDKKTI